MTPVSTKNPGLRIWTNERNGFTVLRLHYSADQRKDTAWAAQERLAMPANEWNREYEIDFSSFVGKPVFLHDFDVSRMVKPIKPHPKYPIIRAWDFGYHHPAVAWCQFFDGISFRVYQSDMGNDIDFRLYVQKILHHTLVHFPGHRIVDCCDRAGAWIRTSADETEVKILINEFGIVPRYRYFKVKETIELMRKLMNTNYKQEPAFLVNDHPNNTLLIDALKGGYHYGAKTEGRPEKEEPEADGFYENIVDPVRYAVANFFGHNATHFGEMLRIATSDRPQMRPDFI